MRPSGLRRRTSFTLVELIVVIAVLLLLMAIVLPSFLGVRGSAQDRAVQSNITVAYHNAKAAWAEAAAYPALAGTDGLIAQLGSAEPGLSFITAGAPTQPKEMLVERDDDQTVTICGKSATGRFFCLRANEEGALLEDAAANASPAARFTQAAATTLSRSTADNVDLAKCLLADAPGETHVDCADIGGSGAPSWTSRIAVMAPPAAATPPQLTWVSGAPADSEATTATFQWTLEGSAAVTCKLDGDAVPCGEGIYAASGLGYGGHTFMVSATNSAGTDALPAVTWSVLRPAPTLAWVATPVNSTDQSPTLSYETTGPDVTIACTLDGNPIVGGCANPIALAGLSYGSHTVALTATNSRASVSIDHTWQVERPAPAITWTSWPSDSAATTGTVAFSVSGPDVSLSCSLDGSPLGSCVSPVAYTVTPGNHLFSLTVTNTGGSVTENKSWQVYAPPTVAITGTPAAGASVGATSADFGWNTTNTTSVECSLDGAAFGTCPAGGQLTGLSTGAHQFQVRATGPGGTQTATRNWTILPQPTVNITGGPAEGSSSAVDSGSFTFTTTNATSTTCSIDGAAATACASPFAFSNLSAASHTFKVNAISAAGTISSPVRTWTVQRTYSQEVVASGASHYYRMNEATCADTAPIVDQVGGVNGAYNGATHTCALTTSGPLTGTTGSGNRYVSKTSSGTNNGGTTKPGAGGGDAAGSAWNFPGSAAWMSTSGSVEVWFKTGDTATGSHFVFDKFNSVAAFFSGGSLNVYSYRTLTSHNIAGLADNNWHHLVVAVNGANIKVFVDGTSKVDANDHGTGGDNTRPFAFGWRISGSSAADEGYFFNGAVDEIAFYNGQLTLADAQAHYAARLR